MENTPTHKSVPKRLELFKEKDEQEAPVLSDTAPPLGTSIIKSEPTPPAVDSITDDILLQCLNKAVELGNSDRSRKNLANEGSANQPKVEGKVVHPGAPTPLLGKKQKVKCQLTEKLLILEPAKSDSGLNIQKELLELAQKCGCFKEVQSVLMEDKPLPLTKDSRIDEARLVKAEPCEATNQTQPEGKPEEISDEELGKVSIPISYLTFTFMVLIQQCFELQFPSHSKESDSWSRIKAMLKNMSELKSSNLRDLRYYLRLFSSGNINEESQFEKRLLARCPAFHEVLVTNTRHVVEGSEPECSEEPSAPSKIEEELSEDPGQADSEDSASQKKSKKLRSQTQSSKKGASNNWTQKTVKKSSGKASIFTEDSDADGACKRFYLSKMMVIGHQPEALIEACMLLLIPAFIESKKIIVIYGNDTDFPELDFVIRRLLAECLPKLEVKFINHDAVVTPTQKAKDEQDQATSAAVEGETTGPVEGSESHTVEFYSAKSLRSRNGLNLKASPSGLLLHRTAATTMKDSTKCRDIMNLAYRTIASDFKVYRPKLSESCRRGKTNALVPFALEMDDLWCHLVSYSITLDLARLSEFEGTNNLRRSFAKVYKVDSDRKLDLDRLEKFVTTHIQEEDSSSSCLEYLSGSVLKALFPDKVKQAKNILIWRFDTSTSDLERIHVATEIDRIQRLVVKLNEASYPNKIVDLIDLSTSQGVQTSPKAQQFLAQGLTDESYRTPTIYLVHGKFIPLMLYELDFSMMICLGNATYLADFRNFLRHTYQTRNSVSLLLFHASKSDNFFEKPLITSTFVKVANLDYPTPSVAIAETSAPEQPEAAKLEDVLSIIKEELEVPLQTAALPTTNETATQVTSPLRSIADFMGIHSSILVPSPARLGRSFTANMSGESYSSKFVEFLPTGSSSLAGSLAPGGSSLEGSSLPNEQTSNSKPPRQKSSMRSKPSEASRKSKKNLIEDTEGPDSVFLSGAEDKEDTAAETERKSQKEAQQKEEKKLKKKKAKEEGKKQKKEAESPSEESAAETIIKNKKKSKKSEETTVILTAEQSQDSSRETSQKKKDKKKAKKLKKKKRQNEERKQHKDAADDTQSEDQDSEKEQFLKKRSLKSPSKKQETNCTVLPASKKEKQAPTISPKPSRNLQIKTPNSGSNSTDELSGLHNKASEEMEDKMDSDSEGMSQEEDYNAINQQMQLLPMVPHQIQPLCLEIDETNEHIIMSLESRDNLLDKLKSLSRRTQIPAVLELALKKTREAGPILRIPFLKCGAHFFGFLRDHFDLKPTLPHQRPIWETIMLLIPHQAARCDIWDPAINKVNIPVSLEQNISALASNMLPKALVYADQPEILMGACLLSVVQTLRDTGNLLIVCGEKSALHEWLAVLRIAFRHECFMNDSQFSQSAFAGDKRIPKIELISLEHTCFEGLVLCSKEENMQRHRAMMADPLKKMEDVQMRDIWKIYVAVCATQKDWEAHFCRISAHAVIFYKTDKGMPEGGVVSQICSRTKKMVFAQPVKHFISAKLGLYPNKLQAMYPQLATLSTPMQILTQSLLSIRLAKIFNIKGALHEVRIFSLDQSHYILPPELRRGKPMHPATSSSRIEPFTMTAVFDLLEYFIIKHQTERVAIWSFTPQERDANRRAVEKFLHDTKPNGNWEVLDCYYPNLHPRARDTINNKKLKHIIFLGGPEPADLPVYSIPFDLFVFVDPPKFTESFKAYIRCLSLIKKLNVVFIGQCHYSAFRFSNQNGKWAEANPEQVLQTQEQYCHGISRRPSTSMLKLTGTVRVPTYSGPVRIWEWPEREPESIVVSNYTAPTGVRDVPMYRHSDYPMGLTQTFSRSATYQPHYMQPQRGMTRGRGRPRGSRANSRPVMDSGYPSHMGIARPPPNYGYPGLGVGTYPPPMNYPNNMYSSRGAMPSYPSRGMPPAGYGQMQYGHANGNRGMPSTGYPGYAMPMYPPSQGMPASSSSYQMMMQDPQRGGYFRQPRGNPANHESFNQRGFPGAMAPGQKTSRVQDEDVFVEEIDGSENPNGQTNTEQGWDLGQKHSSGFELPSMSMQYTGPQKPGPYPGYFQGNGPQYAAMGQYASMGGNFASSSFSQSQQQGGSPDFLSALNSQLQPKDSEGFAAGDPSHHNGQQQSETVGTPQDPISDTGAAIPTN